MIANPLNSMITDYFNQEEKNSGRWKASPAFKAFSGMFDGIDAPDTFTEGTPYRDPSHPPNRNKRRSGIAQPTDPYSKEIIGGVMSGIPGILRYMEKSGMPRMTLTARPEEETYY